MWWKILISFLVIIISSNFALADCPSADLTDDCFVDFEDFAVMANQWLTTDPCIPDDMAYIPNGEFEMGDHYDVGSDSEKPVHTVYVDFFFMSKYEITNQQYCDFLNFADVKVVSGLVYASSDDSNDYLYLNTYAADANSQITYTDTNDTFNVRTRDGYSMADHPVVEVTWYGAAAYCNWRSQQEGYQACYDPGDPNWPCDFSKNGYRLPTEAEWEYAARGGCHDSYYKYPWCGNNIDCSKANFANAGNHCNPLGLSEKPYTSPVGYYSANNYGLYDMTGNAEEWCNDWHDPNYYEVSPYDNPTGPDSGTYRVLRGGAWMNLANSCRSAFRPYYYPTDRLWDNTFRLVLDLNN